MSLALLCSSLPFAELLVVVVVSALQSSAELLLMSDGLSSDEWQLGDGVAGLLRRRFDGDTGGRRTLGGVSVLLSSFGEICFGLSFERWLSLVSEFEVLFVVVVVVVVVVVLVARGLRLRLRLILLILVLFR